MSKPSCKRWAPRARPPQSRHTDLRPDGATALDAKHLDELIQVDRTYWWHVAKRELGLDLLRRHFPPPARLVEGGLGGGANLLTFRDLGYGVSGFDMIPDAIELCRRLGIDDARV